jgi:hypothetical protein
MNMSETIRNNAPELQLPPRALMVMVVLWPSFLMACVSSGIVFSLIDPEELLILDRHWHLSNLGVYTIGFLLFWALGCIASGLTAVLLLEWRKRRA